MTGITILYARVYTTRGQNTTRTCVYIYIYVCTCYDKPTASVHIYYIYVFRARDYKHSVCNEEGT